MNEDLSNKILERIDADQIAPMPRWRFLLLRGSFWLLAILSVIVGSFSIGTILFLSVDFHRHEFWAIPHEATELLLTIPYIWIILFALFILVARISVKHTRRGYRHQPYAIVFVCVLLSIILGSVINFGGVGKMTHELLNQVPFYNSATYDSKDAWNRPDIGRLAGIVLSINENNDFSIMDFAGHIWRVRLATSTNNGSFVPEVSSTVRMFGLLEPSLGIFVASSVHEWEQ
jgi:hypothetical protein